MDEIKSNQDTAMFVKSVNTTTCWQWHGTFLWKVVQLKPFCMSALTLVLTSFQNNSELIQFQHLGKSGKVLMKWLLGIVEWNSYWRLLSISVHLFSLWPRNSNPKCVVSISINHSIIYIHTHRCVKAKKLKIDKITFLQTFKTHLNKM